MAQEITITASLTFNKPSVMSSAIARSITAAQFNVTANFWSEGTISVATGAGTAIPLGQVTTPHWAFFRNMDSTNFVTVRNGSGGTDLLKLLGGATQTGEVAFCPLLDTGTPWAITNTAAVLLEYLIVGL